MAALRTATSALLLGLLTVTSALAGGPPMVSDDAGTVEVGKFELELNGSYTHDKETVAGVTTKSGRHETELRASTGLYKDLGISLATPYTFSAREDVAGHVKELDGFGDTTLEVKYAFAELAGVNVAIKPAIIIPTGRYSTGLSEGRWQYGSTLIASREFAEGNYAIHANLGYEHHDTRSNDLRETARSELWSGSVAGEMKLCKGLTGLLDWGLSTNPDTRSNILPVYVLAGLRYEINEQLDINAGIKAGLTAPEDDVSLRYGLALKF